MISAMIEVSVVVCAHNPRERFLLRVLSALQAQTLPKERWEFLLVDNASAESLASAYDLSWHPHSCHVREGQIGLTNARLTGIREARGDLIVFVDDDNLLERNYLAVALKIAEEFPQIGAFGCSISAEFETEAPPAIRPFIGSLCIDEIARDEWDNQYSLSGEGGGPYGAGMCVRSIVARRYLSELEQDSARRLLDRSGLGMGACGDTDLAWTAIDLGFGNGRFKNLKMVHLIPVERLTEDYIVKVSAGFAYSIVVLEKIRGFKRHIREPSWRDLVRFWIRFFTLTGLNRRVYMACWNANRAAWRSLMARR
jgi:glycosyltransferase involved in cell wall biosynthesis